MALGAPTKQSDEINGRRRIILYNLEGASVSDHPLESIPHPDDLILVGVYFVFQAKLNPSVANPPPLLAPELEQTFEALDAADYFDRVSEAIRERRLFGFLFQEQAESAVGAGDWIAKTDEEVMAEVARDADARINLPNIQNITIRRED